MALTLTVCAENLTYVQISSMLLANVMPLTIKMITMLYNEMKLIVAIMILPINHKNQAEHDTNQRHRNTKHFNQTKSMVNLALCYGYSINQSQKPEQI